MLQVWNSGVSGFYPSFHSSIIPFTSLRLTFLNLSAPLKTESYGKIYILCENLSFSGWVVQMAETFSLS